VKRARGTYELRIVGHKRSDYFKMLGHCIIHDSRKNTEPVIEAQMMQNSSGGNPEYWWQIACLCE